MSSIPSRLDVRLLGPVEVAVDGRPLEVDTRKALALLAYLVTERRSHSRGHLGDLLWPDSEPERARAALRRTLSSLRAGLGGRWVEADRDSVRFVRDDAAHVDTDLFHIAVTEGGEGDAPLETLRGLQAAAEAMRGPFMDGFGLRDAPAFDDWMMTVAEQLRREGSALFERLSSMLAEEGRFDEAIGASRRRVEMDPLHEGAYRSLMLLHAWAGDRAGAVAAYRQCVAVLGLELGVDPLDETVELHEAILEGDLPRSPRRGRVPSVTSPHAPQDLFVGRGEELDVLIGAAAVGTGVVVVEGELGMGKTRLLREFASHLGRTAVVVSTAGHRATSGVPYGPIQQLLEDLQHDQEVWDRIMKLPREVLREAARLAPAFGDPPPPTPDDPVARTRFVDAVARLVGRVGERVVLVVDDIHYCDDATLELLGYLSTRTVRLGLLLVLAVRPEDVQSDGPVAALLSQTMTTDRVRLGPLGIEDVVELLDGAEADPRDIYRRSGGVPLFAVELADAARRGHTGESVAVRRLLVERLSSLDPVVRQIASTIAVLGAPSDVEMIRAVSGRSEDEVVESLEVLITRGLLREDAEGLVSFQHEQLRDLAYELTALVRRRLLHRRAAEHLLARREAAADQRFVASAAAHHRAAGDDAESADLSVRAGDLAMEVFAVADALTQYEYALALEHPDRPGVLRRIGSVRMLLGSYGAALSAYESARAELHVRGREAEAAELGHEVGEVYRRLHRWDAAAASYEEAWSVLRGDPVGRSRLAADWAYVEHRRGSDGRARELAGISLTEANRCNDPDVMAHALNLAGMLEADSSAKRELLEQALSAAVGPAAQAAVLNNLALAAAADDDHEAAVRFARRALDLVVSSGDRHHTAALYDNLADFLHRSGDDEGAMESLKVAVSLFAEVGSEPGLLEPEIWLLKQW